MVLKTIDYIFRKSSYKNCLSIVIHIITSSKKNTVKCLQETNQVQMFCDGFSIPLYLMYIGLFFEKTTPLGDHFSMKFWMIISKRFFYTYGTMQMFYFKWFPWSMGHFVCIFSCISPIRQLLRWCECHLKPQRIYGHLWSSQLVRELGSQSLIKYTEFLTLWYSGLQPLFPQLLRNYNL